MRRCVFHIGMPKTGSTAIQHFLSDGLRDSRYRYLDFGETNGSNALCTLFADNPEQFWCYTSGQRNACQLNRYQAIYTRRLQRGLQAARTMEACPILSGEECWRFSREELIRVRQLLARHGYEPQIVVYLRPYSQWLASSFQQSVKWDGACNFSALLAVSGRGGIGRFDYHGRLRVLADVFGHSQLLVRAYTPAALGSGGVVSDFCATVGIERCGHLDRRANESLTLDALRVFYALNRHGSRQKPRSLLETGALVRHLAAMPGPPLRFSPLLLASIAGALEDQHQRIQQHFGVDLGEALPPPTAVELVACEDDLLRFSPAALTWLAEGLGGGVIGTQPTAAEPTAAAAVAAWLDRRRGRLLRRHVPALVLERLVQSWRRLRSSPA